jgi:excisionase family DNA binding protein
MTTHIVTRPTVFSSEQLMHTIVEAARVLHVSRSTIYVLINNGALKPVHIGRAVRISRAELERYVAALDSNAAGRTVDGQEPPSPPA